MLYELAYPVLYLGAKSQQMSVRTKARLGWAPKEMGAVVYKPETRYRILCWFIRKQDIRAMMLVAPRQAARTAVKRFETTKRDPRAPVRLSDEEKVRIEHLTYQGSTVRVLRYGPSDGPKILSLHGWNGKASMLHKMNLALGDAGFNVFAPDLPGHGGSEGTRFAFHQLGHAVKEMFADEGTFAALIGHSGGGLIGSIALSEGFPAKTYIPIGAPSSLHGLLKSYVEVSDMPEKTLDYIARHYARRFAIPIEELGAPVLSSLDMNTLVLHDKSDWMVNVSNAQDWADAAAQSEVELTEGYTHLSIVKAPAVHERVISFIQKAQSIA
ncbi:MAG: alpha/beta fold hydrolase [Aliishimia sp.]